MSSSTFLGFPALPKGTAGVLVDRCLSDGLARSVDRFAGFKAVHLNDVYSQPQATPDVQFLHDAGTHGWAVFTQNFEMRRTPPEFATIQVAGTRVFTLTTAKLPEPGKGLLFGRHLVSIRRRLLRPGPCFWRLYEERKTYDLK